MKIDSHGKSVVITQDKLSLIEFCKKFLVLYERFKSEDIIIHLTDSSLGSLECFSDLVSKHIIAKHCFVVVSIELNQEDFENFIIIPTLHEAHDFMEMELMQRELGL